MFSTLLNSAPKFETRKALIILNLQNDSFDFKDGSITCQPADFIDRIKTLVPYYRKIGDVIWVRTEIEDQQSASPITQDSKHSSTDLTAANVIDLSLKDCDPKEELSVNLPTSEPAKRDIHSPASRSNALMRKSAKTKGGSRKARLDECSKAIEIEGYQQKSQNGDLTKLYRPGTRGTAFIDDLLPTVDNKCDLMVVKHQLSAFDTTSLLLSLRMKLVTHIHLCGLLSNLSVYSTAADAVRHGLKVTVVEDCLGYRTQLSHLDAICNMADVQGVSGINIEELIGEARWKEASDATTSLFSAANTDEIQPPLVTPKDSFEPQRLDIETPDNSPGGAASLVLDDNAVTSKSSSAKSTTESGHPENVEHAKTHSARSSEPPAIELRRQASKKDRPKEQKLGPADTIGEGDSKIMLDVLSPLLAQDAFQQVRDEVDWQAMRHRNGEVPRRVAVQGEIDHDGSRPIYRHPADESPPLFQFTQTVEKIRKDIQILLEQPFNHALIQFYRDGQDNISEHSDKTLDIVRGSIIANVSLGAERVMTLRTKKSLNPSTPQGGAAIRQVQRIPLPHNSVFVLGSDTNTRWLHGIRPDKRQAAQKSEEENAYGGERISITFRQIGTFTDADVRKIWGQGAVSKYKIIAGPISTTNCAEMDAMIAAFGKENQQVNFNWIVEYGDGFNVVNLVSSVAQLYLCDDRIANLRISLALLERGVPCQMTNGKPTQSSTSLSPSRIRTIYTLTGTSDPTFRDVDEGTSEIVGDLAILFYLCKFYPILPSTDVSARQLRRLTSHAFSRVTQANELLFLWQSFRGQSLTATTLASHSSRRSTDERLGGLTDPGGSGGSDFLEELCAELEIWEEYAEESEFIGGEFYAIIDYAFWPVLHDIVLHWEQWSDSRYPDLVTYHQEVARKDSVMKALQTVQKGGEDGNDGSS